MGASAPSLTWPDYAVLAVSLGILATRWWALGREVRYPVSPHTWKVTLAVHGTLHGEARLTTALTTPEVRAP